jgi:peptidyl-prolyl cis-trans isomerase C
MIHRTAVIIACAFVWGASVSFAQAPKLEDLDIVLKSTPDGPVASVNGVMVPKGEFVALYRNETEMAKRRMGVSELSDVDRLRRGMSCVMMLVQRELLLQEARRRKVQIQSDDLERAWKTELENLQKKLSGTGGKVLTEQEILKEAGASREQALKDLESALIIEKTRAEIIQEAGLKISDQQVSEFMAKNADIGAQSGTIHFKQIFFRDEQPAAKKDKAKRDIALKRGEDALNRIRAGQKFEAVAKAVSEAKNKEQGGDSGPLPTSQVPPFLVNAAATLKPGEMSGLIESEYGVHIILLVNSVAGKQVAPEDVKEKVRSFLTLQRGEEAVNAYCKNLMAKSVDGVRIYLDFDKQLAARPDLQDALKSN